jgi:hypothetical protein
MLEVRAKSAERALQLRTVSGVALPLAFLITQGMLIALYKI